MNVKMNDLYNRNADFRGYVDRYCKNYVEGRSITVEEALKHEMVRLVAEYYREQEENRIESNS